LGADRELGFCVSWTAELRQAFARLLAGERPQVSFFQNQTTASTEPATGWRASWRLCR
jgi:hypothetical protein